MIEPPLAPKKGANKKHIGAIALFVGVYVAVLVLLVLPKDMIRSAPPATADLAQN